MKALDERKARKRGGLEFEACLSPDKKRAKLERLEAEGAMSVIVLPISSGIKHRGERVEDEPAERNKKVLAQDSAIV